MYSTDAIPSKYLFHYLIPSSTSFWFVAYFAICFVRLEFEGVLYI